MTVHLTYLEFEAMVVELNSTNRAVADTSLIGRQMAAVEFWQRFRRCFGSPVPPDACYPRRTDCQPSVYEDAGHWRNVFLKRARRRQDRVPGYERGEANVGATRRGLGRTSNLDEVVLEDGTNRHLVGSVEEEAQGGEVFDQLRALVDAEFKPRARHRVEVTAALDRAIDEVQAGSSESLVQLAGEILAEMLPEVFGSGVANRQPKSRALRDIGAFLASVRGREGFTDESTGSDLDAANTEA